MSEGTGSTGASRGRGTGHRVATEPVPGTRKNIFTTKRPMTGVELAYAIEVLSRTLKQARVDLQEQGVRFETESVELTLGVELVGTDSVRTVPEWRVRMDEHRPPESGWAHTLKIRLALPPA